MSFDKTNSAQNIKLITKVTFNKELSVCVLISEKQYLRNMVSNLSSTFLQGGSKEACGNLACECSPGTKAFEDGFFGNFRSLCQT